MVADREFARGEVYPSYHIDRFQEFASSLSTNFRVRALNSTTVQVAAGTGQDAATIGIGGRWRWSEVTVTRAMPGGAAGTYSIFATAADNVISNSPQPNTDNTNYAFALVITSGANPTGVDLFRLIATAEWDGAAITAINPIVYNPDNAIPVAPTADLAGQTPLRVNGVAGGTQTGDLAQFRNVTGGAVSSRVTSAGAWAGPAALSGTPTAPTAAPGTNTTQIATTAFVNAAIAASAPTNMVTTDTTQTITGAKTFSAVVNGVTGFQVNGVALAASHLSNGTSGTGAVVLTASPTLSGVPLAPTAAPGTNTTQIATTAFVTAAVAAVTVSAGSATPLMDGTATAGVSALYSRQDHVHPTDTSRAPLASPTFSGTVTIPTAAVTTLSGTPNFSGAATGQTAAVNTNTTALATTAFVVGQAGASTPAMDGTGATGTSLRYARDDHVHPTDTTRAALAGPTFTGTVTIPTAAVTTFSGTPNFSGAATGLTAAPGTNTTQLATTAFVLANGTTLSATTPLMDGTATVGVENAAARGDHRHPTDTSRAPTASPTLTGTVTLPSLASTSTTLGFYGVTPVARPSVRTLSNWTSGSNALRTIDRNAFTEAQLFDFVMTLVYDLQQLGLLA